MKTNHFFASANTSKGFINFFDYINTTENSYRYVIKGSSGCGKSTLMKKIASNFKDISDIEYFYCSSDPSSLDGVRLVNFDISIVDGTSPHVNEAKIPSVCDEIINLGEYINRDVIFYKEKISKILAEKSKNYTIIYSLLSSVGALDNAQRINYEKFEDITYQKQILDNCSTAYKASKIRKLFLHALEVDKIIDLSEVNNFKKIILPLNKFEFALTISAVKDKILKKGNDLTLFYDLFSPSDIIAFCINGKNLYTFDKEKKLNEECLEIENLKKDVLKIASNVLGNTRKLHFELEKIYSEFIDFNGLDNAYVKIKSDIEKRINKIKNFN